MSSTHAPRLLIIPGLHDSGPAHWQSWLQERHPGSVRVEQANWEAAHLPLWTARIEETLAREPSSTWIAVAHSFGCLALARYLAARRTRGAPAADIRAALLVAPADPAKFDVIDLLPISRFWLPSQLIASQTDPWMPLSTARTWASIWGAEFVDLGNAGHINVDSGFGPLPQAEDFIADHSAAEPAIAHHSPVPAARRATQAAAP
ncbi:alpha/beta fold hydrolase [soil metagenome]